MLNGGENTDQYPRVNELGFAMLRVTKKRTKNTQRKKADEEKKVEEETPFTTGLLMNVPLEFSFSHRDVVKIR